MREAHIHEIFSLKREKEGRKREIHLKCDITGVLKTRNRIWSDWKTFFIRRKFIHWIFCEINPLRTSVLDEEFFSSNNIPSQWRFYYFFYCRHIPKAKATTMAETPELKRIAENTKIQSNVKYHAEFEKAKGKFTQVADDPETLRIKQNSKIISNVAYHGELEKKAIMEQKRTMTGENGEQIGKVMNFWMTQSYVFFLLLLQYYVATIKRRNTFLNFLNLFYCHIAS